MLKFELEELVSSVTYLNGRFSGDELAVLIVRQMSAVMATQLNIVCAPGYEAYGSNKQCKSPRSKNSFLDCSLVGDNKDCRQQLFCHQHRLFHIPGSRNEFQTITSPLFQMFNQLALDQTIIGGIKDQLNNQSPNQDQDQPTHQDHLTGQSEPFQELNPK